MPSQRFKLTLAYRGTRYHGWQAQQCTENYGGTDADEDGTLPTVQDTVARAIESVVRHPVTLVGSSRTDAGVHAKAQIAHFDTEHGQIPPEKLRRAINHQTPDDIFVRHVEPVPPGFDAILSTASKRYQYAIWNSYDRRVLASDLMWHRWQPLDIEAMRAGAAYLLGRHDFTSFARVPHGREHAIRTIYQCQVSAARSRVVIGIEASGFLWHMVRIIVGTLAQVGVNNYPPQRVKEMLEACDRRAAGPTAPPHGLHLQWIKMRPGQAGVALADESGDQDTDGFDA